MNCDSSAAKAYAGSLIEKHFDLTKLAPTGRLQFFYHSPSSEFPVRDVLNQQRQGYKTEPHLENNAENYLNECYQKTNIQGLLKCREEYLFLFTTCRNAPSEEFYGTRYIVGYIHVEQFLPREGFIAVQGETNIVSFKDAYRLEELDENCRHIRVRKLNGEETETVLDHLRTCDNIKGDCIAEIERLEIGLRRKDVGKCG